MRLETTMDSELEDSILPTAQVNDADTFRILISSDNHLGVYDNSNSSTRGKTILRQCIGLDIFGLFYILHIMLCSFYGIYCYSFSTTLHRYYILMLKVYRRIYNRYTNFISTKITGSCRGRQFQHFWRNPIHCETGRRWLCSSWWGFVSREPT
jgi:hypothetical protein